MITFEQARSERLRAECRRRMAKTATINVRGFDGRRIKDAAIEDIDRVLDQIAECEALPQL